METFLPWAVCLWWLWLPLSIHEWIVLWVMSKGEASIPDGWKNNFYSGFVLFTFLSALILSVMTVGTMIVIFAKGVNVL